MSLLDEVDCLNAEQAAILGNFQAEYVHGFRVLNKFADLKKATFYGAARVEDNSSLYQETYDLAFALAKKGYVVLNGGGPGMMEAATNGAEAAGGHSVAITINIDQETPQDNADKIIQTTNFSVRKYLLRSSDVLIFVPGGVGTLDELAEVLVLAKFKKIPPKQIFLYNTDFWMFLEKWLDKTLIHKWGMNYRDYQDVFVLVDSMQELVGKLKA